MTEPSLPEKVVAIDDALRSARIQHAFGGALALAYYAEPRATIDIDVNVFLGTDRYPELREALNPLGVSTDVDEFALERDGQCRLWWERTPVDLFFAYDEIHEAMRKAARTVPFAGTKVPILSPEHLLVCKAAFDRSKDWIDIEQMLVATQHLDVEEARDWLERLVGDADPRAQRFEELVARLRDPPPDDAGD